MTTSHRIHPTFHLNWLTVFCTVLFLTANSLLGDQSPSLLHPSASSESQWVMWYRHPAKDWVEALPVGNGRLGAMVFGGTSQERIQLNEESVWSSGPFPQIPDGIHDRISEVRQLLFAGKYAEGEALAKRVFLSAPRADNNSHQTLGDLYLTSDLGGDVVDYRRSLDLDTGIAVTTFRANGIAYRREVFASEPAQVLVVRLTTSQPGTLHFTAKLDRPDVRFESLSDDTLVMSGQAIKGNSTNGVKFAAALRVVLESGESRSQENILTITNADAVTILLTVATDYSRENPREPLTDDYRARALKQLDAAAKQPYAILSHRSVADHRLLFRRVDLALSDQPAPDRPTNERLRAVKDGAEDPQLVALYFQYGRYLLMGCSRPGDLPSNLQGIWNKDLSAPWGADYHININIQMDYWPAEVCNLSECHEPFFDFIEALAATSGREAARQFYGMRGFVGHYTTDAWLYTPFGGSPQWALWQMGGAWCTRQFMEHYWFTGDRKFLKKRAYPILRDASLFLLDWLCENPKTGKLVAGPSASPENRFIGPDRKAHSVAMGNSMDQEVTWDTFNNFLAAAHELGIKDEVTEQVQSALERLAWPGIGSDGRLMEWAEEFPEPEPGHRHVSHLFGLHPGHQFNQSQTPEYMAAARKSLEYRLLHGGGHTGWSRAWIINFWARFKDAEKAHENVQLLLQESTLNNLFDTHPPFQIDGNFGGTAGIAEMLLQSHAPLVRAKTDDANSTFEIELLPALPKEWSTGHFTGLRARGGFDVSVEWKDGEFTSASIKSLLGKRCRVRLGQKIKEFQTSAGETYVLPGEADMDR